MPSEVRAVVVDPQAADGTRSVNAWHRGLQNSGFLARPAISLGGSGQRGTQGIPPALSGTRKTAVFPHYGVLSWYEDGPKEPKNAPPLLLIHSVSAASSAYDMKPFYEHYRHERRVIALDLPGFGFSSRQRRVYTPRVMANAIGCVVEQLAQRNHYPPMDAIALSLSSEFLARAVTERSRLFRTVGFVSPTGFEHATLRDGQARSTQGRHWLYSLLTQPAWRRKLYDWLTHPKMVRYFLRRTFGRRDVDAGLLAYDVLTSMPRGAEFAPLSFLAGYLFSNDSGRLYQSLRCPVWVAHGDRGSFARAPGLAQMRALPNWRIDSFQSGAMPQFEQPQALFDAYNEWLSQVASTQRPQSLLGTV